MVKSKPFSFAFQPIVDINEKKIYSYEALIRGAHNESAYSVLSTVEKENLAEFDNDARYYAISLASKLHINSYVNLNFCPDCLINTEYVARTLEYFQKFNFVPSQLIIEVLESEMIHNPQKFRKNINFFRGQGIKVAIDDFGAGYSGLNLVVDFQPDLIKLDMNLIRDIAHHGPRQAVVKAIIQVCESLGISIIAEGIEEKEEYLWLKNQGIYLFQGYFFAKPAFEELPQVNYPLE